MIKADLHIHTEYSPDSTNKLEAIIKRCLELKIGCIAVLDHGTAEGALELEKIAPFKVIVAEEILTLNGEIIGLFLKETIPSGLSVDETIARIREQKGLVCIPHPIDILRMSALKLEETERLAAGGQIDLMEVLNARTVIKRCQERSKALADKYDIPGTAGSDAHSIAEIGSAYLEMPDFNGRNDFIDAVKRSRVCGHRTGFLVHLTSFRQRILKKLIKD